MSDQSLQRLLGFPWVTFDLDVVIHVIPSYSDEARAGQPLLGHAPSWDCPCRPELVQQSNARPIFIHHLDC